MYNIEQLLAFMKQHDASDMYLTVGRPPSFKIHGAVKPAGKEILSEDDIRNMAASVLTEDQAKVYEKTREHNLAIYYPELGRYRVNLYVQRGCPAMVVRKIETEIKTLKDLKLPDIIADISMDKRGLVLVVGATGSGKSTTVAAMIDHRNRNEEGHIVTIEDPIEFIHDHKKCVVSQREVGVDTESFKAALKNTLRQAPTAILIGEVRDNETMEHAINFAETGHLCLATLHSNNANQAMERIISFFATDRHPQLLMMLSLNLRAIISQRLVKSTDGSRAAAVEILTASGRVRDLIRKGQVDELKEAMEKGSIEGMQTFDQALLSLYQQGRITLEEALVNADSATDLKIKVKLSSGNKEELKTKSAAFRLSN